VNDADKVGIMNSFNIKSMQLDHIGIAVKDIETAVRTYEKLLNTRCFKQESVEAEKVLTAFFKTGESKVELMVGTEPDSVITKYIEKHGEGLHHVAFEVSNLEAELTRLKAEGFRVLNKIPGKGADNKLVAFVHPKHNHGVLIELCQSI